MLIHSSFSLSLSFSHYSRISFSFSSISALRLPSSVYLFQSNLCLHNLPDNCRKKLQSLCFLTFQICSLVCGRINLIWVKFPIVQTLKEKNPKANDFLTFFWLTSCPTTDSQCIEHDYLGYPISLLVGETEWIEVLVFTL
ncbi:unnamed protein product [Lactuca virosa]|uniref:Uncharacterized protein n=1 Tax=Lactuca virosa TaxID=75947 RepID=A0AAU9LST9_9ASTR|nr:unnamed protein product [Lactuca virosa]